MVDQGSAQGETQHLEMDHPMGKLSAEDKAGGGGGGYTAGQLVVKNELAVLVRVTAKRT